MKRRTPPRAEKTAFAASPDVGEHLNSDAKTPRGLNQNRRRPGKGRDALRGSPRTSGQIERPGRPDAETLRQAKTQPSFAEAKRQDVPERRPKTESLRALSADMPPASGDKTASDRASGMFRPPCPRTARRSRRARNTGQADEHCFGAVAQRPRGQKASPQGEHGSKKGKEQQKGLSSPGQSRKRKALFMFMRKR